MRRLGIGPVGACIAAAPVLFDAYQLNIEQHILSEAFFTLLVMAALAVLLWRSRPSLAACAGAGVLLAAGALTRSVGVPLIAPALVFALVRGGPVRTVVLLAAFALPLAGYATWYSSVPNGSFALTDHDGYFLYGRVADFASCNGMRISLAERRVLCDPRPPPSGRIPTTTSGTSGRGSAIRGSRACRGPKRASSSHSRGRDPPSAPRLRPYRARRHGALRRIRAHDGAG